MRGPFKIKRRVLRNESDKRQLKRSHFPKETGKSVQVNEPVCGGEPSKRKAV